MPQHIDVIVYDVMMDRYLLCVKAGAIVCMGIVVPRTLVPLQAFRFGMGGMVAWQFPCNINRNSQIFVKKMSHCPCGGRLFGIGITGYMHFRHRFLRFRGFLFVCHRCGKHQQEHQTDEFDQSLHLFPF